MSEKKIGERGISDKDFLHPDQPIVVPESESTSEKALEEGSASGGEGLVTKEVAESGTPTTSAPAVAAPTSEADKLVAEVEDVLEEDLADVYKQLPQDKKIEFKVEGEKTAVEVVGLLHQVKIKTTKIYHLIKKWLKLIPGVNRFFLTQEAKIKTDKVVELEIEERDEGQE